jgi:DNA polymerase III subunit epsilon
MKIAVGFDLETTGLDPAEGHRIIEIAASLYDLDTGTHLKSWVKRVNPQRPIDPKAQAVHGITFEAVQHEPVFEVLAPKLSQILKAADVVVAHNGIGFDKPFTKHELLRVGVEAPEYPMIDTMLDARWATCDGKLPKLGELCFALGVEYDPRQAHSAEYDVRVLMEAFFKARRKGFFLSPTQEVKIVA